MKEYNKFKIENKNMKCVKFWNFKNEYVWVKILHFEIGINLYLSEDTYYSNSKDLFICHVS